MKYSILMMIAIVFMLTESVKSQVPEAKFKKEFLERINHTRQTGCTCGTSYMSPAPPLVWNDQLAKAGLAHARDMYEHNYFSHTSKDGRTELNRVENAGYKRNGYKSYAIGENIAQGQQSIAEVMDGWFKSEGHCMNLMNPSFKEVGVAEYDTYWVQDFGGRETFSPEMLRMIKSGKVRIIPQTGSGQ